MLVGVNLHLVKKFLSGVI